MDSGVDHAMSPVRVGSLCCMPLVTAHFTISVDGFMAGPDQTQAEPLGVRGEDLHRWMFEEPRHETDTAVVERILAPRGAYVMGRNMFGPVRGEWGGSDWSGWWGDDPPYHAPVFVLTHHPRDPVEMEGGTTFHFVGSFEEALERAVDAAGDDTVTIAGGASAVRQGFQAGVVDEFLVTHSPIVLGGGVRPFDDLPALDVVQVEVLPSPKATHVVYRVDR
jgi:dihydrofolate reductase